MKQIGSIFLYGVFFFFLTEAGFGQKIPDFGIIPRPEVIEWNGQYSDVKSIQKGTIVFTPFEENMLGTFLSVDSKGDKQTAAFRYETDEKFDDEAYEITISKNDIHIKGGSRKSIQYGLTTLAQMIRHHGFPLPEVRIYDKPYLSYRGMHLDVCRHFFTIEEVKKYLDYLAYYKYNHFHWHLTEDQGWRIEIKKYPKLQEIAAYRKETLIGHYSDKPHKFDGQKYGGYYTQDEVKEIVAYAAERHIAVIPEIEMPGHALAALAAYPELGCSGGPYEVATKWGVFDDVFCPTENTFRFLEGVIDEVIDLFPYEYIHIGGDECPKTSWENSPVCQKIMVENGLKDAHELQSYFIKRMEKYINAKGRKIIGWDEILEGGLAPNATVMSWRGTEGGIDAAKQKHKVIMTPGSHCYFDYYQSESADEPVAIGGFTPLKKVYHWNPVPKVLNDEEKKYIWGGQANVWTEYIKTFSQVEYMAYARGMAMSEALWHTQKLYAEFLKKFVLHQEYWSGQGVKVANHIYEIKPVFESGDGKGVFVRFDDIPEGRKVSHVIGDRTESGDRFLLSEKGNHEFFVEGKSISKPLIISFNPHLATDAVIKTEPLPSPKYSGNGPGSIINGVLGSDHKYGGSEWLGFEGKDVRLTLDWEKSKKISKVSLRFYKGEGQWIYLPRKAEMKIMGKNGQILKTVTTKDIQTDKKVATVVFEVDAGEVNSLQFFIQNYGIIPAGAQGSGHGAWLFLDEVVVE
jgi:hexosaminidase